MKIRAKLKRLRHLTSIFRKHAVKQEAEGSAAVTVATPNSSSKSESKSEGQVQSEPKVLVEEEDRTFHLFSDLPIELKFKIWGLLAESTTQVIHIVPLMTGRNRRECTFNGCWRCRNPFPPFLQVSRELRKEGLRYYDIIEGESGFNFSIPFSFKRDIFFVSFELMYFGFIWESLRSMMCAANWRKIQNIAFQVCSFDHYPLHLDILEEMSSLKELHFTSYLSAEYRQNLQEVLDSEPLRWGLPDTAAMLGHDDFGQVDHYGFDDADVGGQRPFHFHPLKLEFEFARLHCQKAIPIKLSSWRPSQPLLSLETNVNGDHNEDGEGSALVVASEESSGPLLEQINTVVSTAPHDATRAVLQITLEEG